MIEFEEEQMKLGELVDELLNHSPEKRIMFDFEYARPVGVESWRGVYAELAITFEFEGDSTVGMLLPQLQAAICGTFTGYKGGDFLTSKDTPLWVANHGHTGNTAVVAVHDSNWAVVIETAYCSRWD